MMLVKYIFFKPCKNSIDKKINQLFLLYLLKKKFDKSDFCYIYMYIYIYNNSLFNTIEQTMLYDHHDKLHHLQLVHDTMDMIFL